MESSLHVVGLRDAIEAALRAAGQVEFVSQNDMKEFADEVVTVAQEIVPVKTGRLRDSIKAKVAGTGRYIEAGALYAEFVEFGTSKMVARPYLAPAVASVIDGFLRSRRSVFSGMVAPT